MKLILFFITFLIIHNGIAQHTIKVRKELKIEGLFKNTQSKDNLPTYFYFTEDGTVYYTFSKKLKEKKALVKLTLCALDATCTAYPKTSYEYKKGHIRLTIKEDIVRNYFVIYDGQLSDNGKELSVRKEETNQLILVNKYVLIESKN